MSEIKERLETLRREHLILGESLQQLQGQVQQVTVARLKCEGAIQVLLELVETQGKETEAEIE